MKTGFRPGYLIYKISLAGIFNFYLLIYDQKTSNPPKGTIVSRLSVFVTIATPFRCPSGGQANRTEGTFLSPSVSYLHICGNFHILEFNASSRVQPGGTMKHAHLVDKHKIGDN